MAKQPSTVKSVKLGYSPPEHQSLPFSELEKQYQLRKTLIDQARVVRDQKARELQEADARLKHLVEGKFSALQIAGMTSHLNRPGRAQEVKAAPVVDSRAKPGSTLKAGLHPVKGKATKALHKAIAPQTKKRGKRLQNEKSVKDLAYDILSHGPMDVPDLSREMLNRGYRSVSNFDTFCQSVVSQLTRDKRFTRVGVGRYSLASDLAHPPVPVPSADGSVVPQM